MKSRLRFLQRIRHRVEGRGQLADFVGSVAVLHAHVKLAAAVGARGLHHLADGLDLAHGRQRADDEGNQQNDGRGHEEQPDKRAPHLHERAVFHHGEDDTDKLTGLRVHRRDADDVLLELVHGPQTRPPLVAALAHDLLRDVRGQGNRFVHDLLVRGEQDVAVCVADEEVDVRDHGCHARHAHQVLLLIVRLAAVRCLEKRDGDAGHELRAVVHLVALFRDGVVIAQRKERHAEQQHRQQHHTGCQEKLLPVETAKALFQGCRHRFHLTSNL